MSALTFEQADRLVMLAHIVPMTCEGAGHEDGSAYCNDFDGDLTDLMADRVCSLLGDTSYATDWRLCDQVAAYLYGRSADLRAACATVEADRLAARHSASDGAHRALTDALSEAATVALGDAAMAALEATDTEARS